MEYTRREILDLGTRTTLLALFGQSLQKLSEYLVSLSPEQSLPEILNFFRAAKWETTRRERAWFLSPPQITRRQLALGDWYLGKEWNANQAAQAIMRHFQELWPGQTYRLIGDGVIDFTGKVTLDKFGQNAVIPDWIVGHYDGGVWGGGACWAVSTWGAAHDDFNAACRDLGYNFDPIDNKSFPNATHPHLYKSYQPMENWDNPRLWRNGGYTIYQGDNGLPIVDYAIRINPVIEDLFPNFLTYLDQDISFHFGKKPRPDLPRDASSFMTSRVSLVLEPIRHNGNF